METKKVILVIDDEPDLLETMQFYLENMNFRVIISPNGTDGIQKAQSKPDLILLDLNMPDMSGHEVCRRLKEDDATRSIPIIMLTAQTDTLDKVQALSTGVIDYIGKHFPLEEIMARIKAVLRETSAETAALSDQEKNKKITELRKIIDTKAVRILYQPIVSLTDREPIGYEALTRGPRGSSLESPLDLFGIANEANMFFELDGLCRRLSAEKAHFLKPGQLLFLNTDPSVIEQESFKKLEFMQKAPIKTGQLCIEITERTCIKNFAKFTAQLASAKSLGIKFAIDDVGEGYSSLKAIAELKPDYMKIDIALVRGIDTDPIKAGLAEVMANLAKHAHSHCIAEGIETDGEHKALLSLGVEYGQGYLFAKPQEM